MRLLRLSIEYDGRVVFSSVATLYALDELVRRSETAAKNIEPSKDGKIVGQAPHAIRKLGERLT
jgi:hypothetical protein